MAAHNPIVVDIFYYGTASQKNRDGEVAELLAKGNRLQRMLDFGKETVHYDQNSTSRWV